MEEITVNQEPEIAGVIARWIEEYRDRGASQSSLANALGLSPSVINQIAAGKYAGRTAQIEQRIAKYIASYGHTQKPALWIETAQTKMARIAAQGAIDGNEMAALYGEAGTGKTYFIRHLQTDYPNMIYLEIVRGETSRDVLREICAELKIQPRRSNYQTFTEICASIGDRIIVIDQAEFLRNETMEYIRSINDRAKVPIILLGVDELVSILGTHKHFESRVKWKWAFQRLEKSEARDILEALGLDPELAVETINIAKGNFRSTAYLLDNAIKIARGGTVTAETLRVARQLLFI
jgi:DNA transposition AAA+ family ATPase